MKKLISTIALVTAVLLGSCMCAYNCGRSFNYHVKKQINVSSPMQSGLSLASDLRHMDITVTGQDVNECSVIADLFVAAETQEIADQVIEMIGVELVQETDRLVLVLQKPLEYQDKYSVSGRMEITVPSKTSLAVVTTHGDCSVDNIIGKIRIQSTHGDFTFNQIEGDIIAVSTHGAIEFANSTCEKLEFNTTHGGIKLIDSDIGHAACSTTHDPIRLNTVSANALNLRTSHDPIELIACTAERAELNSSHGAIRGDVRGIKKLIAQTTHAPIRLHCINDDNPNIIATLNTTHNNIEFSPPTGFAGSVRVSTSHGRIHSDLPIVVQGSIGDDNVTGTVGQGTGSIAMVSSHGNIKLKSQKGIE